MKNIIVALATTLLLGLVVVALAACGGGSSGALTGVSAVSVPKFCNDANATFATLNSRVSNNIAPLGKSELTSLAAQLRTLAGEDPAEIKADLTTIGAFFDKESINGTVDSATTSAATAAGDRVSAWGDQNCGSGSNSNSA